MSTRSHAKKEPRIEIRGVGWKKKSTIAVDKYQTISTAILKALGSTPIAFTALVEKLGKALVDFDGSIAWYAITCLRELEVQGKVIRQAKPVRYLKPTESPRTRNKKPRKPS